ncbi:uncharacterized protein LOC110942466 [Helianthus annuus]|uniref:uncharacterized protein LOC110942466 n=1 Tax=Helianthus annuus TaxID=4232 RepID=UPI001652CB00|nr:uncharacterized protein LOC110942466 [Helianthus annuus]
MVSERIGLQSGSDGIAWSWKKYPSSDVEVKEVVECHRLLHGVRRNDRFDQWIWNKGSNALYSVKETRIWLNEEDPRDNGNVFKWSKWIPNKCNIFLWRASMDQIPTLDALRRRNIVLGDGSCYLCGEAVENTEHIFTACRISDRVWTGVASWCRLPSFFLFSIDDIRSYVDQMNTSKTKKEIVYGVLILTAWRIWKARNEKAFDSIDANVVHIVSDVKALGCYKDVINTGYIYPLAILQIHAI